MALGNLKPNISWHSVTVGPIANLKGPYFQPSLTVCLCVCLSPALLPFVVDRFWWNLVTRPLLRPSSAATIMVHIGRSTPFWKFEKILKNHRIHNSGPLFFASVSPVYCKKIRLDSNKTDGGDRFWSLPLWRFRQWHCCSSTTLGGIFWLNRRRNGVQQSKLGGIPNWGCIQAVNTNRLVCLSNPALYGCQSWIKPVCMYVCTTYDAEVDKSQPYWLSVRCRCWLNLQRGFGCGSVALCRQNLPGH